MRFRLPVMLVACLALCGCGTTQWSDTKRTATEQLLISDAMDRAVSQLDFCSLAGKKVYLDAGPIEGALDAPYLVSSLRQHMLASGCMLKDGRDDADYIVEVRAGAVGTDRRELFVGVPATKVPSLLPMPGVPASIPELPLAKRTEQRAVVKIALFAYNRETGRPVWQSGAVPVESKAKDLWVLGAGPFQRGTIYDGTEFAGGKLSIPLISPGEHKDRLGLVSVADEAFFSEPREELSSEPKQQLAQGDPKANPLPSQKKDPAGASGGVVQAGHTEPALAPKPDRPPRPIGDPKKVGRTPRPPAAPSPKKPPKKR